jgi:hypothetical protein
MRRRPRKIDGDTGVDQIARIGVMLQSTLRHGHKRRGHISDTYRTWMRIKRRCSQPNDKDYATYGARGIRVCERWHASFDAFLADMGERPQGTSIDRIDFRGHYEPGNCRWADITTQIRNRSNTVRLTLNGQTQTIQEWSEQTGIKYTTIRSRIRKGWPVEKILLAGTREFSRWNRPNW